MRRFISLKLNKYLASILQLAPEFDKLVSDFDDYVYERTDSYSFAGILENVKNETENTFVINLLNECIATVKEEN